MDFFTDDNIALVHSSDSKEVSQNSHKQLVEVYKKLEHLCKLIKKQVELQQNSGQKVKPHF